MSSPAPSPRSTPRETPWQDGAAAAPGGAGRTPSTPGSGLRPRSSRPRVVPLCLLLLGAVALGCVGMAGALDGGWWMVPVAATVLTVLVVTGAARWLRLPSPLVTVAGLAALLLALTVVHLGDHALLGFIPVPDTFTTASRLWTSSGDFVSGSAAPYPAHAGLAFVLCALVGLVTVFMETVLVGLRMAGLACVGLLALLVVPALTLPGSVSPLGLAAAVLAALALLAGSRALGATRAQRIAPAPGGLPRAVLVVAGVLAVVLFVPSLMPGFFNGAFPQGSSLTSQRAAGVGPLRAVGQDLRSEQRTQRFSYTSSDDKPAYMRLLTLSDFSQDEWFPATDGLDNDLSHLADSSRNPVPRGTETTTKVTFDQYDEHWLPAPYAPVAVAGLGDQGWGWSPKDLSVYSAATGMSGGSYTVTSAAPPATAEALRRAPSAASDDALADDLRLPADRPQPLADAARSFTQGARTDYDRALALQNHLRKDFHYDVNAPLAQGYDAGGMASLEKFMQTRTGYAGHFAPAMALMAREVGIPARVAVGYLPTAASRDANGGTSFSVGTGDAHAWPELYFENVGWVRFEPTPGVPSTPDYAPESGQGQADGASSSPSSAASGDGKPSDAGTSDKPSDQVSTPAEHSASAGPYDQPEESPAPQQAAPVLVIPWWALAGGLLLVLVLVAAVLPRWLRGRRRRARLTAMADTALAPQRRANAAWDEFRALAEDYGVTAPASDTPRVAARRLAAGIPAATPCVERLVEDLETTGYGAPGPDWTPRTTPEDLARVRDEFRHRASRGQRFRAAWWPASLRTGPRR